MKELKDLEPLFFYDFDVDIMDEELLKELEEEFEE